MLITTSVCMYATDYQQVITTTQLCEWSTQHHGCILSPLLSANIYKVDPKNQTVFTSLLCNCLICNIPVLLHMKNWTVWYMKHF